MMTPAIAQNVLKKPKAKAKVEVGVQVAKFNHRHAPSAHVRLPRRPQRRTRDCVQQINNRVTRHLGACRRSLFERVPRSALKSLATDYVLAYWKQCRAGISRGSRQALLLAAVHTDS